MHILLTDIITCPRCGPSFGLILLADEIVERDVRSGWLGCANCRERYPIEQGALDLRAQRSASPESPEQFDPSWIGATDAEEAAFRLAALLGVPEGGGSLLLAGATAATAGQVAALLPAARVLAEGPAAGEEPGVSRVRWIGRIPLRDHALRGLALAGAVGDEMLGEARRVLMPGSRVVVLRAAPDVASQLTSAGFTVLLDQEGVVVASVGARG